ncbi:MAG: flotillin family protein [Chloroflexota bacterium]|nr:MAG: flotillin [Chloroflexota bacterium]
MPIVTIVIIIAIVVGLMALVSVIGSLYRKVGPNQALVVYGRGGTKVVVGGGTVVLPLFQSSQQFSLELISFDLVPRADLYTQQGIPVKIEAVTQLKVENEDEKIKRAANQFLSKRQEDREGMIRQLMEGHLRGIVGQLTVEQLVKEPDMVSARMRDTVAADLDKLGLEIVSFTIKDVNDDSGYIANLSRPEIAANQKAADIAEADAQRDVAIRRAQTQREAAQAEAEADQMTAVARTEAHATQAAAQRDLDLKTAEFRTSTATAQAQAEMAGEIAKAEAQRKLVEQQTQTELLRAQRQKDVQAAEADRKQAELVAEVQRPAEAKATAARVEAEGQAAATRSRAQAEAQAARLRGEATAAANAAQIRETGTAEAETIRAKGLSEAEALARRVEAENSRQEVALQTQMLSVLPQLAEKLAQGYAKVGSITYIGSGDGDGGVAGRVGRDMIGMIPALGSMVQSVTGRSLADIFGGTRNGKAGTGSVTSLTPDAEEESTLNGAGEPGETRGAEVTRQ